MSSNAFAEILKVLDRVRRDLLGAGAAFALVGGVGVAMWDVGAQVNPEPHLIMFGTAAGVMYALKHVVIPALRRH